MLQKFLELAASQLGYTEESGNRTKYAKCSTPSPSVRVCRMKFPEIQEILDKRRSGLPRTSRTVL